MHGLFSGRSVTCDTLIALEVQLRMEKVRMLSSEIEILVG
jgi:hypothetical protein